MISKGYPSPLDIFDLEFSLSPFQLPKTAVIPLFFVESCLNFAGNGSQISTPSHMNNHWIMMEQPMEAVREMGQQVKVFTRNTNRKQSASRNL